MDIIIKRDSVCMGDDIEDHTLIYTITETTKFSDLFHDLIHQEYFPCVSGNDVVWTLYCGHEDLMSWKTKENELYSRFITEEPAIFNVEHRDVITISFKYYSSQLKRAEWIFKNFGGQKFHIWHEGFKDEYESYGVSPVTEDKWRNNL